MKRLVSPQERDVDPPLLEFVKYVFVSAIALFLDYGIYFSLVGMTQLELPLAAAIGYSGGLSLAYFLMTRLVFERRWLEKNQALEMTMFLMSGALGISITYVAVAGYTFLVGPETFNAKSLAVVVSFFSVYLFRKWFVFRTLSAGAK